MRICEKHMDLLTEENLRELLAEQGGPCVSIYMPTHRRGPDIQQDPIRLKNLARDAESRLTAGGMRPTEAADLMAAAGELVEDPHFWQHQCDGLALFLTADQRFSFRLPLRFDEFVVAGRRFHVKPLLPLFTGDGRFYVLALSQGGVRLLQGSRFTVGEAALRDVPRSLAEALRYDNFEVSLQHHIGMARGASAGEGAGVLPSHGGADAANFKPRIQEFFRKVDASLRELLGDERAPLVLAGVEYIRGLYHDVNRYEHLLEEGIDDQPERLSDGELHRRAWAIVSPLYQRQRRETLERFRRLAGSGSPQATADLDAVVPAAYYKRVDTLFVPAGRQEWGVFDPESNRVARHERAQAGDEDLIELAVVHTLRYGGQVYHLAP
ncbi:MAG: hypothetical protein M1457_03115, partial [bacterium]|nr:hypothetical protein [bacterium]